ncbi:MAG: ribonuclease [Oscillospiraceae bacterium]|nr:ribonuclease [Oscillospiraceae bacterium]
MALLLAALLLFGLCGCQELEGYVEEELGGTGLWGEDATTAPVRDATDPTVTTGSGQEELPYIDEDGWYYSAEDVSLYLHTYGHLPENFITKDEARDLGWEGGSVERYKDGAAIGGDKFGNREGVLPKASGRQYYECDIDTNGESSRGAKRIVWSNDGLIYYTEDHYETFTLLYGEEGA